MPTAQIFHTKPEEQKWRVCEEETEKGGEKEHKRKTFIFLHLNGVDCFIISDQT